MVLGAGPRNSMETGPGALGAAGKRALRWACRPTDDEPNDGGRGHHEPSTTPAKARVNADPPGPVPTRAAAGSGS